MTKTKGPTPVPVITTVQRTIVGRTFLFSWGETMQRIVGTTMTCNQRESMHDSFLVKVNLTATFADFKWQGQASHDQEQEQQGGTCGWIIPECR